MNIESIRCVTVKPPTTLIIANTTARNPSTVVIVVSSLLALAYVWRVVEPAYFQPPEAREGPPAVAGPPPGGNSAWPAGIAWVAVAANVYFGLQPSLPLALSADAAGLLMGHMP